MQLVTNGLTKFQVTEKNGDILLTNGLDFDANERVYDLIAEVKVNIIFPVFTDFIIKDDGWLFPSLYIHR